MCCPTKIGIIGTGFIGRGLAIALDAHSDLTLSAVLTRRDLRSLNSLSYCDRLTNSLSKLIENADLVVECSGDVIHATQVVDRALAAGLPVVTMNTEFQVTVGSYFVGRGTLTEAEGDQPGSIAALAEEVKQMGFSPIVYGNRKGYYHPDPPRSQMQFWAKKQGVSMQQVISATDGTKVQFEVALVANGLGAQIAQDGLLGLGASDLVAGGLMLAQHAERLGAPISDYVLSPEALAGVFIVAKCDTRQRAALEYFKLGEGPYYVFVRNYHLCHLEIPKTIRRMLDSHKPILTNSARPTVSVAAIAKHALKPGEKIKRGIGGFDLRGVAVQMIDHPNHLPIGLISNATVERAIEAGQLVEIDDMSIPDSLATKAWKEISEKICQPGSSV